MYARSFLALVLGTLALGVLFRQVPLVAIGLLGGLTLLVARGWQAACLSGVTYTRRFDEDHVFWGEGVDFHVTLTNFKLLPLSWVEADEVFPEELEFVGHEPELTSLQRQVLLGHTTALRPFERIRWHYRLRCPVRGLYKFEAVTLRSGDLFGLFTHEREDRLPARLYVYPKLLDLAELGLPPRHPFGDIRAQRRLLEDPLHTAGVREYRPEDPFKRIHWKATARTQQLQVRVYEQTTTHTLVLFLNVETWTRIYEGVDGLRAEWALVVAASLAQYAARQGWSFGLQSNAAGGEGGEAIRVPPGRHPGQLTRLLEGLARVVIYPVRPFADLLHTGTQNLPLGSTIVAICPVLPDPIRAELLRLRERGLPVVVCALTDAAPPPLAGLPVYHLPPPARAEYLRVQRDDEAGPPAPAPPLAPVRPLWGELELAWARSRRR